MVIISLADPAGKNNPKGLEIDSNMFKPHGVFAIGAAVVCVILAVLYYAFW
jgi:solute:Na+ symporter, SSS family